MMLPEWTGVDKLEEFGFHCMPLACFDIVDSGLHFYLYIVELSIEAYYAIAVKGNKKLITT